MVEVDPCARRLLDRASEPPVHLRRRQREALVGALGQHPEARHGDGRKPREDRRAETVEGGVRLPVERHLVREREVGEPEDAREPPPRLRPRGEVVERQQEARRGACERADGQPGGGAPHVVGQAAHEERPVASLERDLVIAEHDHVRGAH